MPFAVSNTQTRPSFAPHPEITLVLARVHEVCGSARRTFALWLASRMQGPVIWITPGWIPDQLNPEGMTAFADPGQGNRLNSFWVYSSQVEQFLIAETTNNSPKTLLKRHHILGQIDKQGFFEAENSFNRLPCDPGRFIFVRPRRYEDLLWCMEETLRSGAVPLAVADLPRTPDLTPVRRMHLAAEQGWEKSEKLLAPLGLLLTRGIGTRGVETRWHMAPKHQDAVRRWHLSRRYARAHPPMTWDATQRPEHGGLEIQRSTDHEQFPT